VGDAIGNLVKGILAFLTPILSPDWGALVGMLPVFLVIGVVGPLLSLLVLGWFVYFVRRPRARIRYQVPQAVRAQLVDGGPVFPAGEPYCVFDQLVYPPAATRCDQCGRDLAVRCPKCDVGRPAYLDTCSNCGLVLKIDRQVVQLRPAGPPPGGAAAA
jgi:hypothetical protein